MQLSREIGRGGLLNCFINEYATTMTHDEIRRASTKKLKDILKNDDPDVDLHDMIDYELYIREYS